MCSNLYRVPYLQNLNIALLVKKLSNRYNKDERNEVISMLKQFQSVRFDDDNKKLDILMGTIGEVSYEAIEKAAVLNEEASFHGKSIPGLPSRYSPK